MNIALIVEVEVDVHELAELNAKRNRLGQQMSTAQEFVELQLLAALSYDKLLSGAKVRVAPRKVAPSV